MPCPGRFPIRLFFGTHARRWRAAAFRTHWQAGVYAHIHTTCFRMPHHPPAALDTDEQQQQPQCRICLDGPDPDLGRLIRPCLCSGTVSVRQTFPYPSRTIALTESSHRSQTLSDSTYTSRVSSVGGTRLPIRLPSLFAHNATTATALLVQR